jgi:putative membrane protein
MTDLILAILHHLLVFSLVALLAIELTLVRKGLTSATIARLAAIDGAYGAIAGLVLIVGFLRVFFGLKGAEFYFSNGFFWAKIAAFAAVGILSIPPTLRFLTWRRASRADPSFTPSEAEIGSVRRMLHFETVPLVLIPIFAAAMARGYDL